MIKEESRSGFQIHRVGFISFPSRKPRKGNVNSGNCRNGDVCTGI